MTGYETDIPTFHERFTRELRAGELPKAIETGVEMDVNEPSVTGLLSDFETAVSNGETDLARTLLAQIRDAYDRQTVAEQRDLAKASVAIENADLTAAEREELIALVRDSSQLSLQRSEFYNQAVVYLDAGADAAPDTADVAAQTRQRESTFEQTKRTAPEPDTRSVGAAPRFLGSTVPSQVAERTQFDITLRVGNVGGADATGLAVTVDVADGASPAQQTVSIDTIAPDESRDVTVQIRSPKPERARVAFDLQYDGAQVDSVTEAVPVVDRSLSVREAISGDPDAVFDTTEVQRAISLWAADDTVPGTGGEAVSTDQIQQFVTEWIEQNGGGQ